VHIPIQLTYTRRVERLLIVRERYNVGILTILCITPGLDDIIIIYQRARIIHTAYSYHIIYRCKQYIIIYIMLLPAIYLCALCVIMHAGRIILLSCCDTCTENRKNNFSVLHVLSVARAIVPDTSRCSSVARSVFVLFADVK